MQSSITGSEAHFKSAGSLTETNPYCLYITYDGLTDPLGQSQVLPYVTGLTARGYRFHIVSFEKPARFERMGADIRQTLADKGIDWTPLSYTKHPPIGSTVFDVMKLAVCLWRIIRSQQLSLIHCRGYVPSLVGAPAASRLGVPFVFDMRGFWADEKVDAGAWSLGNPLYRVVYRFFKSREQRFLENAAAIVVLTQGARRTLARSLTPAVMGRVSIIPCSVDFQLFRPPHPDEVVAVRKSLGLPPDSFVLAYVGSIGTWYRFDEMLSFFRELRGRTRAAFLIVTADTEKAVRTLTLSQGISPDEIVVRSGRHEEVARMLMAADAGISFISPADSKISSSPTKIAEYLAAGLPVIANAGVCDTEHILTDIDGGVIIPYFSEAEYVKGVTTLLSADAGERHARRERARRWFDLDSALDGYAAVYSQLVRTARMGSAGDHQSGGPAAPDA